MGAQAAAVLAGGPVLGTLPPGAEAPRTAGVSLRPVPRGVGLDRVARSHGWCALAPYAYDRVTQTLHRVLLAPGPVAVAIRRDFSVDWGGHADAGLVREQLRWCLGLDDDLAGAPPAVAQLRMLRAPSFFEDAVKTVLSTHTSFAALRRAVGRLTALGDGGAFPSATAVLRAGPAFLRDTVRAGYRAHSLLALAELGDELEDLRGTSSRGDDELLLARLLRLPGVGPLSARGLMALLGRPRPLEREGWALSVLDLTREGCLSRYAAAGRWAGSAQWADVAATWGAGGG